MSSARTLLPDDGAARHLRRGRRMPDLPLPSTAGREINFAKLPGRTTLYCYPWTGRPDEPNPPDWDNIPGAHGSTPQTEGYRDLWEAFNELDTSVFGLSTQSLAYQREMTLRLKVPFEIISDVSFALQRALSLPVFEAGGVTYLKRITLGLKDGTIERVFYPVPHPAADAREVCAWLGMTHRSL